MKILIATDGSKFSNAAIDECCRLFKCQSDVEIKIISVYEEPYVLATEPFAISGDYYQQLADASESQAGNVTASAARQIRDNWGSSEPEISVGVLKGPPEREIIETAIEWDADLIVVGSHGRGFWGRMLGSVSNGVVHHAPCSVLVVREPRN